MVPSEKSIIFEEADLPHEEEILRNSHSVRCWLHYVQHKQASASPARPASLDAVNVVYERALKELPGSYKLWYNYLKSRRTRVKPLCVTDPQYEMANNAFERALVFMHKMPRIWIDYCQFLVSQGWVTRSRQAFDRALRALPVTQHHRIWPLYLKFVKSHGISDTALRVYRRHLQLSPENAEEFIAYLISIDRLDEAAVRLAGIINDKHFVSKSGKSKHQLWNELCDLLSQNPTKVRSLKVDPIIRQGLKRFSDQIGTLWKSLAVYYIRAGLLEKAVDVYEESVQTVVTVRDFNQVFTAYTQFMEDVIQAMMEKDVMSAEDDLELERQLERLEALTERQPLLLNSVLLRQNPHNVHEWHKRVQLHEGNPIEIVNTYAEAVKTVDCQQATGKPHTLWCEFAKFYEKAEEMDHARVIFGNATKAPYKHVDDLAQVYCEWAEMEIRHEKYPEALKLMQKATAPPPHKVDYHDGTETVQLRVHKSLKLWSMYADLEESFGTFQTCKAVYDKIIDLRIATPQIIMNYGMFLEESNYFEEAFKAYEKGIALFRWPNVFDIWNVYLSKFIQRYGGKKLERARDLFEQCLQSCPLKFTKNFYLLYAKLEEEYGLTRHAMAIYKRATEAVGEDERYDMFNIYLRRATAIHGGPYTRAIYEEAINVLKADKAREMSLRFANLERKLGEIDRARAIYTHCSQMCDPRSQTTFWDTWKEFEIKHGNEDTMREMLRIKRSVQATYNTQVNFMASQLQAARQGSVSEEGAGDEMAKLESKAWQMAEESTKDRAQAAASSGPSKSVLFVRSSAGQEQRSDEVIRASNPEEIAIDDDFSSDDEQLPPETEVRQQAVPSAVYGGLAKDDEDEN